MSFFDDMANGLRELSLTPGQLAMEGRGRVQFFRGHNWSASPGTVTAGAAQNVLGTMITVRPGKKLVILSINISLSGSGFVEGVLHVDATQNWYTWVGAADRANLLGATRIYEIFGPNGGNSNMTFPHGWVIYQNSVLGFQYTSPDTTGRSLAVNVWAVELPDEPNPDAKFKIGIFGDSTAWGANLGNDSQGRAYLGKSQWSETFRDQCRANGVDAQIFFNVAEDGKTMMEGAYMMLTGYGRTKCDMMFVSYGMNDAVSTKFQGEAKFKEAVSIFIAERNRYNAGKPLVFLLPVMTDDTDRTGSSRHANIRTWLTQAAQDTSIGGGVANKVYLVDQASAITLGNTDYKEQVAGTYVHPNGAGSTKIGNYLWNQLKSPLFGK